MQYRNGFYLNIIGAILLIGGMVARYYNYGGKYTLVAAIVGFVIILLIFIRRMFRR